MFLKQAFTKDNKPWKYLIGIIIVVIGMGMGQIPFTMAIAFAAVKNNIPMPRSNNEALTFLDANLTLALIILGFVGGILGLYVAVRFLHKQTFSQILTTRSKIDWKRIFFSFTLWGIVVISSTIVAYLINPEDYLFQFDYRLFLILVLIAFFWLPFQTSAEEFIFRGYLMQGFALVAKNKWFPLLFTSILFGLLHLANPEVTKMGNIIMIYYIGTGLFLGVITLMDEGMELALGFHAANNIFSALLVTSEWSALQTHALMKQVSEPSSGIDIFLPIVLLFPLMIFIFAKKYHWYDWQKKLLGDIKTP